MNAVSTYSITRSILLRYMADFTTQTSPPRSVKNGHYCFVVKDTGDVWFTHSRSFASTLTRYRAKANFPDCITKAVQEGKEIELWFLTQPDRRCAKQLEAELDAMNLLLLRKRPITEGPGELYIIRHDTTQDYFILSTRRTDITQETLLGSHLNRLAVTGSGYNKPLEDFITANAQDIMNRRGFSITPLCKFKDADDLWLQRQLFIDDCKYGKCLNLNGVE